MDNLSARQTRILKTIVDEYIQTAAPVASLSLEHKYNLGVSPATIRNEMMTLSKLGFLRQPHTSAGRVPTPKAMKFYINQLMEERALSLMEEVRAKENVWDFRDDFSELMAEATRNLSQKVGALGVSATEDGNAWFYGHSNLFDNPEFFDFQVCKSLFSALEEKRRLRELLFERLPGLSPIEVLFGEELGWKFFEPIGIVASHFEVGNTKGVIGVIGPFRLNYPSVIPIVRYFGNLIEEIGGEKNV